MREWIVTVVKQRYEGIIVLFTVLVYSLYRINYYREPRPIIGYRVLYLTIIALILTIILFFALIPLLSSERYLEFIKKKIQWVLKHPYRFLFIYVLIQYVIYIPFSRTSDDVVQLAQTARLIKAEGLGFFFANYREMPWIGYQYPPLAALMATIYPEGEGLNNAIATIKLITVLLSIFTILALYEIAKIYFSPKKAIYSAILCTNMYLFMKLAVDGRIDSLMTFFTTLTILYFLRATQTENTRDGLKTGIFAGLGLYSNYKFILTFVILFVFCILDRKRVNWKTLVKTIIISFLAILPWLAYSYSIGVLKDHWATIRRPSNWIYSMYSSNLFLYFRNYFMGYQPFLLIVLAIGVLKLLKARQFRRQDIFFMFWAFFPFIFYTFSYNRVVRYTTPGVPAFAILIVIALSKLVEGKDEQGKYFLYGFILGCTIIWGNLLVLETVWDCCFVYYAHQLIPEDELPLSFFWWLLNTVR